MKYKCDLCEIIGIQDDFNKDIDKMGGCVYAVGYYCDDCYEVINNIKMNKRIMKEREGCNNGKECNDKE